jgi:hypothetical protein
LGVDAKLRDVKLPDGTVIKNVPEGTTQNELIQKLSEGGHDVSALKKAYTQSLIDDVTKRGWGTGLSQLAYDVGGRITDHAAARGAKPEFAAAQGFIANMLTGGLPAAFTSASGPSLLEKPAKWLMQTAVKPSSTLRPEKVNAAMGTMLNEGIYPTMSGMGKANKIVGGLDDMVDGILTNSPATVSVPRIGSHLREPFEHAKTQVNPKADMAAVRAAWDDFRESPLIVGKTEIPVKTAHEIKKGTYRALGKKSYNEIGSASDEAQKALASGARAEVAAAVPEVQPLLSRQADLMNVKEVAMPRALIESNKNPLGLTALRLDHPASAAAFWADRFAALKAFLAMQLNAGGRPGLISPGAVTADNPDVKGLLAP